MPWFPARYCGWTALLLAFTLALPAARSAERSAIEVTLKQGQREGRPLQWSQDQIYLLGRDGRVWDFAPSDVVDFRAAATEFRSLTKNELRGLLQQEFGAAFEVTSTGNYLVVHPAGEQNRWAERFESLYRSFWQYFQARGFRPQTPLFPLVGIVFPNEGDYQRYAAAEGTRITRGVVGYYSPKTNRIALYDGAEGKSSGAQWQQNAATLIHEAAHQTAFNTGVHSRWSMPPRWAAEGLGTLFEARGVYDSAHYTSRGDRINQQRFEAFQKYAATRRRAGALAELIQSDRMFQIDPDGAYAEAWALTFFLSETEPRKYFAYLTKTAQHSPFGVVRAPERLKDFTSVFGERLDLLEAQFLRFMKEMP